MKYLVGGLLIVAGILLGAYVSIWLMLIGGIMQIIHGITPIIVASDIAFGVARIALAGFVGSLSAAALIIPGLLIIDQ